MEEKPDTARDVEYWREVAKYDLETAEAMLGSRRYVYVLFTCQQAIEKMLKGLVVRVTGEFPPRTHNLLRLAEAARLELSGEQEDFLARLGASYVETRYPRESAALSRRIKRETAVKYLGETRGMFQWLEERLA